MKTAEKRVVCRVLGVEMLKFDVSFKYASPVVIIDFGPDDPEEERQRSTGEMWSERKA